MKPIIQFDHNPHDYYGEFIEPNVIKIYTHTFDRMKANPLYTVIHEYTHYFIHKHKILLWLVDKLNTRTIEKYKGKLPEEGDVYVHLPEEKLCNWVANKFCKKYLIQGGQPNDLGIVKGTMPGKFY